MIENFPPALVKIGLPAGKSSASSSICVALLRERGCSRAAGLVAALGQAETWPGRRAGEHEAGGKMFGALRQEGGERERW